MIYLYFINISLQSALSAEIPKDKAKQNKNASQKTNGEMIKLCRGFILKMYKKQSKTTAREKNPTTWT